MKKFCSLFLILFFALLFSSCGKKGDLLPPLIRLPQAASEVRITQKSDRIVLFWKNPTAYEDGTPISTIEKIEVWMLKEDKAGKKDAEKKGKKQAKENEEKASTETEKVEFGQKARLIFTIEKDKVSEYMVSGDGPAEEMRYEHRLHPKDLGAKNFTFGIRVKGRRRFSAFSDLVSLEPLILSLPPQEVAVSVFQDRIEVKWKPPSQNVDHSTPASVKGFNIYRFEGDEKPRCLNGSPVKGDTFSDRNFVFGQTYTYFVRASATESPPYLESENSDPVEILARDTFAPSPPQGLISVAGEGVISLNWNANPEDDVDGYRVWRQEEGEKEFIPITRDIIKENTYNDRAVKRGRTYSYCVTVLDRVGNESQKSEVISDKIREGCP
jgi:hypothetical protein